MNEQLRGRETVLEEEVLLQFTSSSWNGFNRLVPVSGVQTGGEVRGFLVQALEAELWALQEGNNLLLLTRGFTIPCTLKQSGPSTYLLAHSCRPTTDADAVNAFRDGVLIKGRWLALLPDEVPGASQGAASLCCCVFEDPSVDSGVAARIAPAIPVTNTAPQSAIIQGVTSGVVRTVAEPAMVPVAVQAAAGVPSPVGASVSAPAAQPVAASFSLNPVDMGISSGDLPSDEVSGNISQPVVSSAEPLFRLGELAASTAPTVNTQVSMTENGSSDKVSIEYRLEGPQEAVGQLLKQQSHANQPQSELPTGSPRIPDAHETPGVMQPVAPIPATASRLSQWPNAVPAPTANNAGSLDAWSRPTSSVTLSQAAIDAMLSSIPASEPTPVPAPPLAAAMPSPGQHPMMTPRIEVPAPMQQPVMTPRAEVPTMAQPQMTPAVPVRTMPFSQPVQRPSGQASILQPAASQAQSRPAVMPAAENTRAAFDEPMLSQKDIDDLVKRLSGN